MFNIGSERVILVDANDNEIGTEEKLLAHKLGRLHRAFSVLIFNSQGKLLLQKRAEHKYHCGGLWSNTCCSHPRPGESLKDAAYRRLKEEMGMDCEDCEFKKVFSFKYCVDFANGLTENEIDHVFVGISNKIPIPNRKEVSKFKWVNLDELKADILANPTYYTPWLKLILESLDKHNI